jgi:plasmid maintenance system antidote protein VapI
VTVLGGADLDFRDAILPGREMLLRITAVLGCAPATWMCLQNPLSMLSSSVSTGTRSRRPAF